MENNKNNKEEETLKNIIEAFNNTVQKYREQEEKNKKESSGIIKNIEVYNEAFNKYRD